MKHLDPNSTLAELVLERPARSAPLDLLGVNYCCGGDESLAVACSQRGLDPQAVIRMLDTSESSQEGVEADLKRLSLRELCVLLETRHHVELLHRLDNLESLMTRVAGAQGRHDPRLVRMNAVFAILRGELRGQISLEKRKLLPLVRALDSGTGLRDWLAKDFEQICQELSASRATVAGALEVMRGLSNGFGAPDGTSCEMRELCNGIRKLSAQTRLHAHARNNALIPKARRAIET